MLRALVVALLLAAVPIDAKDPCMLQLGGVLLRSCAFSGLCSPACCAALQEPAVASTACAPHWADEYRLHAHRVRLKRAAECPGAPCAVPVPCLFDPAAPGSPCAASPCAALTANGTMTAGCRAETHAYCSHTSDAACHHTKRCVALSRARHESLTHTSRDCVARCPSHDWYGCATSSRASIVDDAVAVHTAFTRSPRNRPR